MAPSFLSEATQSRMARQMKRAVMDAADVQEQAGDQWLIRRKTGGGISGPVATSTLGPIEYHIYRVVQKVPLLQPGLVSVPSDDWRGAGPYNDDTALHIEAGDRLISELDPTFQVDVTGVFDQFGVQMATVEVAR